MAKKPSHQKKHHCRAECESVHFAEVHFAKTLAPRLVIQVSDGLSVLVGDQSSVALATEFIAAFRASEQKGGR